MQPLQSYRVCVQLHTQHQAFANARGRHCIVSIIMPADLPQTRFNSATSDERGKLLVVERAWLVPVRAASLRS